MEDEWNKKNRLCAHSGMQQLGVNYWGTHYWGVNWINVRSLLAIESIHELQSISIDFLLAFPQSDLHVDVFIEIPLGMGVDRKRG